MSEDLKSYEFCCPMSARMTHHKCYEIRKVTPQCAGCDKDMIRIVKLEMPSSVYNVLLLAAKESEQTVEESLMALVEIMAGNEGKTVRERFLEAT